MIPKQINITENSLFVANKIIEEMEANSFHNHFHILYDICDSINKSNISYLEIGCYAGATASLLSSHASVRCVVSIDLGHPIDKNVAIRNVNKFKHSNCSYEYIESNSCDEKNLFYLTEKYNKFDIVYIDGDHSYNGAMCDFSLYKELLKKDGYIIFDDYLDTEYSPQVKIAVDDIIKNLEGFLIIGCLEYPFLNKTNVKLEKNNLFILKKIGND